MNQGVTHATYEAQAAEVMEEVLDGILIRDEKMQDYSSQ